MVITFNRQNINEVIEVAETIRSILEKGSDVVPETNAEVSTSPQKEETIAKPTQEKKVAEEPEKAPTKNEVSLGDLKETAKDAVGRSSRETVKKVISKYGSKLTEVKESDYAALASELGEL